MAANWKLLFAIVGILLCETHWSFAAKAKPCDTNACKLPDCRCTSTEIPGNLRREQTPQIIMITFDDAISKLLYDSFYSHLLPYKNPNGCPIGMTFFTSHEYCDYVYVNEMWRRGHEIASHSISHKANTDYWKNGEKAVWHDELVGMRQILQNFAKVPLEDVKGVRVPFLQIGGNKQFQVMKDNTFLWDCSMPTQSEVNPGIWPYTLEYRSKQRCQIDPCPTNSFPGLWVVPMLDLEDAKGNPCAMLDTCISDTRKETFDLLYNNFLRSYNGNRAPYGLFVHAAWFLVNKAHWEGYVDFLKNVTKNENVYFVTVSQALEWVRHPAPLSSIKSFAKWKTQCTVQPDRCTSAGKGHNCRLTKQEEWGEKGVERYMRVCDIDVECPDVYPWVGNPEGDEQDK